MKFIKFLTLTFILTSVLFAETGDKSSGSILGFKESDNEFAVGFLAGINYGDGFGIPIVWDRGAFGGMFSFGAEARLWWDEYSRYYGYETTQQYRKYKLFGFSSSFRSAYHPFGMPSLKGQVKAAKHIDPYAGIKLGFSITSLDRNDTLKIDNPDDPYFDFPVFSWYLAGIRWYFKENVSLWTEFSRYDWSLGFSFKF